MTLIPYPNSISFKQGNACWETIKNNIKLVEDSSIAEEGYRLDIFSDSVTIAFSSTKGYRYGLVTLSQLENKGKVPLCEIYDYPKYSYRSFMLDVARHFQSVEVIKRLLDRMQFHKLNTLHLHLSDDQGFRLEIESFPELTAIGSRRRHTKLGDFFPSKDYKIHSGYYTKKDIAELVEYAKQRNIEIVPEIDVPGHSIAILASHSELSCNGKKIKVCEKATISRKVMCAGNEKVYEFVTKLLDEVMTLFPSKYIHLGGDECSKHYWKKCPKCQQKTKDENLGDGNDLQAYFFRYFSNYLKSKGRTAIGWNECLLNNTDNDIVAQYWTYKEDKNVKKHIDSGGKIIISKSPYYYFDASYAENNTENVYNFDELKLVDKKENILGMESCLWSEWVITESNLEFKIFPRLTAFSEICWTEKKNICSFIDRYKDFISYYDIMGINYSRLAFHKSSLIEKKLRRLQFIFNIKNPEYRKNEQIKRGQNEK